MTDRRFIEESFPVKEVSVISAKEKNIRHGHISTLHIWWARRPLAASRATAYAALVPAVDDPLEWQRRRDFIVELSRWENSLNQTLLEKARRDILEAHARRLSAERGGPVTVEDIEAGRVDPPRVLDPFAGGGAIPLEALRLGCETYASDYNPVAVLILKATLEYPQKFGQPEVGATLAFAPRTGARPAPAVAPTPVQARLFDDDRDAELRTVNPLLEAVKKWGDWVLEEARKELARFYPPDPHPTPAASGGTPSPLPIVGRGEGAGERGEGSIPVGYIWTRTIPCQNPACGAEIPLMRQFWLAKKKNKRIALHPEVRERQVTFRIVGDGHAAWPEDFDPGKGTVSRAVATCPVCGAVVDAKTTHRLFREGKAGQRMVAVVLTPSCSPRRQRGRARGGGGKAYRVATEADEAVYRRAEAALQARRERLMVEWGMDPVPDEPLPPKESHRAVGSQLPVYGYESWSDLFNARQQLALITFAEKVRQAHERMLAEGYEPEFARAVATYLALTLGRMSDANSVQCWWQSSWEKEAITFARQALQMTWDFFEANPLGEKGYRWEGFVETMVRVMAKLPSPSVPIRVPTVTQSSATQLPYPDAYFDAVLTDPPYYDNVPYSYLSDFFYVWLKRTVGHLYPDLFSTPLTPKANEIVAYSHGEGGWEGGKAFFEENLKRAFQEIHRVLKPGGVAVIVYAHKSTAGWETVTNALLDSGLVMTGAWPLHTEMKSRLLAHETAALASSIYIVARKMARQPTGFYNEVREELRRHLNRKLQRLWEEGIGGADFFIAAIGSAIEVFGRYEQVMDYEGNTIRADRLLQDVRTIATDYAVRQILRLGGREARPYGGEVDDLTRLYVLWRWNYGEARVPFDEARKLAQSCGVDLAREWNRGGFVKKEREFVRLLGPQRRKLDDLEDARELIDVLHRVLLLWEKGRREEMVQMLAASGYGRSEAFYRVAQAISETLPIESKEKKLLDGFLAGRERVREAVGKAVQQRRLFE
ncbi:MAG TPA: DUF1156 domain-containing protein [Chloroflexi bacterium]|nr:DUF1156 domain-containing protein [Chloroflexota bacterium]